MRVWEARGKGKAVTPGMDNDRFGISVLAKRRIK